MGWMRKIRIWLISTVAVALIVLAVAFTVLRILLPHATGYITEIEDGISAAIGLPVTIGSLDADMHWFAPRLKVIDLVIYKEDGAEKLFTLSEANFSLAYIDSIRFMMPMVGDITLHGAELFVERHPNGKWVVQGFELYERESTRDSEELIELILSADIALINSRLHWKDFTGRSRNMDFDDASVILENHLGTQYIDIDVGLPADMGERFRVVAELDGDLRDLLNLEARLHLSGTGLIFTNWIETTRIKEFVRGSGKIDTSLWVHINKARITRFASSLRATDLVLVSVEDQDKTWFAKQLDTRVFWRRLNQGWRLDVRDLNLQKSDTLWPQSADIVVANDETDWRVLASYLKPSDIMPLIDVLPPVVDVSAFSDYLAYVPEGELFNLEAIFSEDEILDLQLHAGFSNLALDFADQGVSIKGLDGELEIDSREAELVIDSRDVVAVAGDLFRWPLELDDISGTLAVELEEGALRVTTPELHASNRDVETVTRASVEVSAGKEVFLDIHTNIANGNGRQAHRYIPVNFVPGGLVDWLDAAFVEGHVPSGSFIFHGVAGEFPFRENQGVMQVQFDVRDGRLHFLDGWPDVRNASATVRFHNASVFVENATSREKSGSEATFSASIPDLKDAMLYVSGKVRAGADELQQYIWNSGLDPVLGRAVEQFQAAGQAEVDIDLQVPLGRKRKQVDKLEASGGIALIGNELYFPATNYLLTDLNGRMAFTMASVNAEDIKGKFYGQPVSINVYTTENSAQPETQFHIAGNMSVETLLKKFNWRHASILDGSSYWHVVMHVPHKATDYDVMFDATSNLAGVRIGLSEIINKPAALYMPVTMNLKLLGDARQLKVVSENRLDLSASLDQENNWLFDIVSPVLTGRGKINADLDANTTAEFDFDFLNLSAFATGDGETAKIWKLKASDVPSLRMKAGSLLWHDWRLSNVEFETDNHPRGMVINTISIQDPRVQVTGKGSWLRRSWRLDEETTFAFELSSANIGETLEHLGYSRYVDKSEMVATLNWRWPGAPYRFSWTALSGNTSVTFKDGVISDIDPGAAGRFLGLFNLLHLPKRLGLDFADVYKKGFVFESITGNYLFGGGDAITQDTEIKASSADLTMMGRIGVANQDYDLVAIVRPNSSVASFAGGTLIAGPTIGVGLMVLQEIFGIELLGKELYRIGGTWSDPVVTGISEESGGGQEEDLFDDDS